jgi:hypothetical protein
MLSLSIPDTDAELVTYLFGRLSAIFSSLNARSAPIFGGTQLAGPAVEGLYTLELWGFCGEFGRDWQVGPGYHRDATPCWMGAAANSGPNSD